MPLSYLFDHNVNLAIARGLRQRKVDVVTAFEDGSHTLPEHDLLIRATELDRVLFSNDDDLLREAKLRHTHGVDFPGVVYTHPNRLPVGQVIEELELVAEASEPEDLQNQVVYLPL